MRYQEGPWESQVFREPKDARPLMEKQVSYYRRLCDDHPDAFRLIRSRKDLKEVLDMWEASPAYLPAPRPAYPEEEADPRPAVTHPVGIVMLMEGAESLREPKEMEDWFAMGARLAGPVWAGTRLCGGTMEPGGFTGEGFELLDVMASLGMILDISHMNEKSALQALDHYPGVVAATHANARALIKNAPNERHLTDQVIRRLVERDGVMGVIPFNRFLNADWRSSDDRQTITLRTLAAHIDHICQIAGDARHAGIGTDFDGGFGWPSVPYEINTIADLQKLAPILAESGYTEESIADIFGQNWRRHLERTLPVT
jgi:membrane dipeptidase